MRIGITPIISIIILLGIAVAISGIAFQIIFGYAGGVTKKFIDVAPDAFSCRDGIVRIYMRNAGTTPILLSNSLGQVEEYEQDGYTVGLWHMNENSGITSVDDSITGNDGTLFPIASEPIWTSGVFGSGLDFDGIDDHVNIGSDSSLDSLAASTICAWIYPRGWGESNYGRIYDKLGYAFHLDNDGFPPDETLFFNVHHSLGNLNVAGAPNMIKLNEWQHVCVTWDGTPVTSGVKLYVNGVESASYGHLQDGGGVISNYDAVDARIGNNENGDSTFDGIIDEVRISNVTRNLTTKIQGWAYVCRYTGNTNQCGDVLVTRKSGSGIFMPSFEDTIIPIGNAVLFKDRCTGRCEYIFATSSVSKTVRVAC